MRRSKRDGGIARGSLTLCNLLEVLAVTGCGKIASKTIASMATASAVVGE
ncbi:MAG: hypothetical protein H0X40_15285 [Chthoniobacterales bacterium]|nr:hypothetical protein [Chthoniobacterales bacterium]